MMKVPTRVQWIIFCLVLCFFIRETMGRKHTTKSPKQKLAAWREKAKTFVASATDAKFWKAYNGKIKIEHKWMLTNENKYETEFRIKLQEVWYAYHNVCKEAMDVHLSGLKKLTHLTKIEDQDDLDLVEKLNWLANCGMYGSNAELFQDYLDRYIPMKRLHYQTKQICWNEYKLGLENHFTVPRNCPVNDKLNRLADPMETYLKFMSFHNALGRQIRINFTFIVDDVFQHVKSKGESSFKMLHDPWRGNDAESARLFLDEIMTMLKPTYQLIYSNIREYLKVEDPKNNLLQLRSYPIPLDYLGKMWPDDWRYSDVNLLDFSKKKTKQSDFFQLLMRMSKETYNSKQIFDTAHKFYQSFGFKKLRKDETPKTSSKWCKGKKWPLQFRMTYRGLQLPNNQMCLNHLPENKFVAFEEVLGELIRFHAASMAKETNMFMENKMGLEAIIGALKLYARRCGIANSTSIEKCSPPEKDLLTYQFHIAMQEIPRTMLYYTWYQVQDDVFKLYLKRHEHACAYPRYLLRYMGIIPPVGRNDWEFDIGSRPEFVEGIDSFNFGQTFLGSVFEYELLNVLCSIGSKQNFSTNAYAECHKKNVNRKAMGNFIDAFLYNVTQHHRHWKVHLQILSPTSSLSSVKQLRSLKAFYKDFLNVLEVDLSKVWILDKIQFEMLCEELYPIKLKATKNQLMWHLLAINLLALVAFGFRQC